jgi:hypothetical protein
VGPWDDSRKTGSFAAQPFGAAITYSQLRDALETRAAARDFFQDCAALLVGAP